MYLAGSELKMRFSCITKDLYSAQVPSNGLGGFSLGAQSCWVVGAAGGGAVTI